MRAMKIEITQLAVALDFTDADLVRAVAGRLKIAPEQVHSVRAVRRAIDARKLRGRVQFILTVEADIADDAQFTAPEPAVPIAIPQPSQRETQFAHRPVVVGAGPAGLVAAWRLASAGARPILIERGQPVEKRRASVGQFWADGTLDVEDNVLFGEGGAGLYSDGKLTTRSKQRGYLRAVLELLVACGADEDILIDAEPHVGSDKLVNIVRTLRERIVELGGDVRFGAKLDAIEFDAGKLTSVIVNGERIATNHCILATGHSARDVYHMLATTPAALAAKAFAVGVRIEFPQSQIDASQFGTDAGHPKLGAASFRLTRREENDARACYTFCMCPGGSVISCASSEGQMTTNGMSLSARSRTYGNAAFLVPVRPEDYGGESDPLAGIAFQEAIESKAFNAAGGDYSLPASRLGDFLAGRVSKTLPGDRSCKRSVPADLHPIFPAFVIDTLVQAAPRMVGQMRGLKRSDGIVYGAETRSSSPVRIVRGEDFQSTTLTGLYPAGEGSGYAGGIVTSAIDGLRAADALLASE
jgi:uncharacterized FAD-dependent dehydrogenase